MIDPQDPPRLRDGSDSALRDVMQAAERDVGTDAQLARMSARLGAVLAPPAAVAASATALGGAAKLGLGALALLVAGGGAWLLSTAQPASPPVPTSSPPAAPAAPALPSPAEASMPPAAASVMQAAPPEAPPTLAPAPKLSDKPVPPAQPTEAELLEQARSALKVDPGRALARANAHAARFPGGALVQEREVIAIKALRQLGRSAEADRRAEAFAKAFPGSAFGRKLKLAP